MLVIKSPGQMVCGEEPEVKEIDGLVQAGGVNEYIIPLLGQFGVAV